MGIRRIVTWWKEWRLKRRVMQYMESDFEAQRRLWDAEKLERHAKSDIAKEINKTFRTKPFYAGAARRGA